MGGPGNYFYKQTVHDAPLDGQIVLLRADYNVPLSESGKIADDYRVAQSIPTLKYLLNERQAGVVIVSHLGRPKGKVVPIESLAPVAVRLQQLLRRKVTFIKDCIGDKVAVATKKLQPGEVLLLENLRFHAGEEANDKDFARELGRVSHARYFVQDGFGVVHRAHASTSAITAFLPSVGGLLLEREYQHILGAMHTPKRPLIAILGGAKIADKIDLIDTFISKADHIVIGGAMANTFLQYKGFEVGKSLVEPHEKPTLDRIYKDVARKVGKEKVDDFLVLPSDVAVAAKIEPHQPRKEVKVDNVHPKEIILDLGMDSVGRIEKLLKKANTVIWNGTLGYAELKHFQLASAHVASAIAHHQHLTSIIGGGDTADFVLDWDHENLSNISSPDSKSPASGQNSSVARQRNTSYASSRQTNFDSKSGNFDQEERSRIGSRKGASFTHISTGGGASLELMAGKKLPGVEALLDS